MLHLSNNCIFSVAKCLGSVYCTGPFRATCKRVQSVTPAAPKKYKDAKEFIAHCCKRGDAAAFIKVYDAHKSEMSCSKLLTSVAKLRHNHILRWMAEHAELKYPEYMLYGAAKSKDVEQLHAVYAIYQNFIQRVGINQYNEATFLLERGAGETGSLLMCEEVLKITKSTTLNRFLKGASINRQLELCRDLISKGANSFGEMAYVACIEDSVEVFDLAVEHLGLDVCELICLNVLKSKVRARIRELRANGP